MTSVTSSLWQSPPHLAIRSAGDPSNNPNPRPSLADVASQVVHTPGLHVKGAYVALLAACNELIIMCLPPSGRFLESVPAFCHALGSFNLPNNFVIQHFRETEHISVHNKLSKGLLAFTNRIHCWLVCTAGSDFSRYIEGVRLIMHVDDWCLQFKR